MSEVAPSDKLQTACAASKKKKKKNNNNKKNANRGNTNGDAVRVDEQQDDLIDLESTVSESIGEDPAEITEESKEDLPNESNKAQANGKANLSITNGHNAAPAVQSPKGEPPQARRAEDTSESSSGTNRTQSTDVTDRTDTSVRLEAMSQDREALRAEVERLRKSIEDLQGKHAEELSTIRSELEKSRAAKEQVEAAKQKVEAARDQAEAEKAQAQSKYDNLLGRVNTIKSSLGERMAADKQELSEAKDQIEELEKENELLANGKKQAEAEIRRLTREAEETSKELSSLRNRHNLSQQNWQREREETVAQNIALKEEAEEIRVAMNEWEVLAREERNNHDAAAERASELEEQLAANTEAYRSAVAERDVHIQNVTGLQRALQELQEARKAELREMVETTQEQISALKKLVQKSDERATKAEAESGTLKKELERVAPFETDIKEKNLLIGKLRHEAIILNEHLTKALRFLKKAKPEDNIDRQLVTNHFLQFIAMDRSDPKKFQVLQIIASLLNWTDEQRETAGLARPGASNSSLKLPVSPFHRTPSTPTLSTEYFPRDSPSGGRSESLAELFTGFLEQEAEERERGAGGAGGGGGATAHSRHGSSEGGRGRTEARGGSLG